MERSGRPADRRAGHLAGTIHARRGQRPPYTALRGEGEIAGYFFCFEPDGCAALGALRDSQYAMIGRYRVPAGGPAAVG